MMRPCVSVLALALLSACPDTQPQPQIDYSDPNNPRYIYPPEQHSGGGGWFNNLASGALGFGLGRMTASHPAPPHYYPTPSQPYHPPTYVPPRTSAPARPSYSAPTGHGYSRPAPAPSPSYSRPSSGYSRPSGGYSRPSGGYSRPSGGYSRPSGGYSRGRR